MSALRLYDRLIHAVPARVVGTKAASMPLPFTKNTRAVASFDPVIKIKHTERETDRQGERRDTDNIGGCLHLGGRPIKNARPHTAQQPVQEHRSRMHHQDRPIAGFTIRPQPHQPSYVASPPHPPCDLPNQKEKETTKKKQGTLLACDEVARVRCPG